MGGAALPCSDLTELFYSADPADIAHARTVCAGCPHRTRCLARALEHREPDGVWGGFTADERKRILRDDRFPTQPFRTVPHRSSRRTGSQ